MPTATQVGLEEYLATTYQPDREYVNSQLRERNVGEWDHGQIQGAVYAMLREMARRLGFRACVETRIQVLPNWFCIPDACAVQGYTGTVITAPPFLCVEVVLPDDRLSDVEERIDNYLALVCR